jgi:predicted PurR-regulated permease PerM
LRPRPPSGGVATIAAVVEAPAKAIVRLILIIVGVAVVLYLLYLLRKPISWVLIAVFIAIALSGPVNWLNQRMRRGFAITIVYLVLLAVPVLLAAIIVPPLVGEANDLARDAPQYARDLTEFVEENASLRELNQDYDITQKVEQEAGKLPDKIPDAAKALSDVGVGLVNSIFALVTILVLTAFLLSGGRGWIDAALELRPPRQRERLRRVRDNTARAVGNYMAGALAIALIAGILSYIVMTILGVPFRGPLAVVVGFFSLIPLIGATIAAVVVGVVTLFTDFPTATIVWTIWAIVYQQFENHVIQPQIQRRAVDVHPFVVLVAVLFGATLLGVLGALVAIPVAATIQIALREYWDWRKMDVKEPTPPAASADEPAPA